MILSSGFGFSPICTINEIPTMPWDLYWASDILWYSSLLKPYNWIWKCKKVMVSELLGQIVTKHLLLLENYNRWHDVPIPDHHRCHNGCKFLQIDIYNLGDPQWYLHDFLYLYLHEKLGIVPYWIGFRIPVWRDDKKRWVSVVIKCDSKYVPYVYLCATCEGGDQITVWLDLY